MALTEAEAKELEALRAEFEGQGLSHAELGSKVFSNEAILNAEKQASGIPSAIRSGMQNMAQGVAMAVPEAVAGATRFASPELADKMERGLSNFRRAMSEGSNAFYTGNSQDGISEEAAKNMYGLGNAIPLGLAGGSIPATTISGAVGGLQAAGEGDTRLETLGKTGLGAGIGTIAGVATNALPVIAGKAKDIVKEKLGLNSINTEKAAQEAIAKADELHKVIKKDVNGIYKELGLDGSKISNEDRVKAINLFAEVKHGMSTRASQQFDSVLSQQAPQEVIDSFGIVPKETLDEAVLMLKQSKGGFDVLAKENPGSLQYYNQLRKMIGNVKGDGNPGYVKEITKVFRDKVGGFADAQDLLKQSKMIKSDVGANLIQTIKSNNYDKVKPAIEEVMGTETGPDLLHKLFKDGLQKELVKNSNLTPLEQLAKSIGSDPLQQSQMLDYIGSLNKPDTARKIKALTDFVNVTKQAQSQPNSTIGRVVGMKTSELDPAKMGVAIKNLLGGDSKFSAEFTKIMQEQVPSATKTEKFFNLLKRAGKGALNVTPAAVSRSILDTTDESY